MSRFASVTTAWFIAGALLLVAQPSLAQTRSKLGNSTWRRSANKDREPSPLSHLAFELRFGGYYPDVDSEFDGAKTPYQDIFGKGPEFYFGLELDWLPARIPYVGAIGPGFGWGYTSPSAPAKVEGTSEDASGGVETYLTIMPMHLSAVLRADELMKRTGVPIVPYTKLGIGWAKWSTGIENDVSVVDGVRGSDVTWGVHFALGGMFSLGWIGGRSKTSMRETTGFGDVYLFGEWMGAFLNGLGSRPQMHVGSSTSWVLGVAVDR